MRKKIIALACAAMLTLTLCGCGNTPDRDIRQEQEDRTSVSTPIPTEETQNPDNTQLSDPEQSKEPEIVLPTATSDDVELYVAQTGNISYVVNAYGQKASGYSLDADGNILDRSQNIIVTKENTLEYKFITKLAFSSAIYDATLTAREEKSTTNSDAKVVKQYPNTITVLLSASPINPTNNVVVVGSNNTDIAEIRANNNAKIVADGAFDVDNGEVAIHLSQSGTARIIVTVKEQGNTKLTARTISGVAVAECELRVKNGEVAFTDTEEPVPSPTSELTETIIPQVNPAEHTHSYVKTVVPPTQYEGGYTLYTCEICSYTYRDNFTQPVVPEENAEETPEPITHVHNYVETVVAPTETERGYTLHVCTECGDSYKDRFVPALAN